MSKSAETIKSEHQRANMAAETAPAAENSRADKTAAAPTTPAKSVFREYFESFVVTLVMAFFGMTFIVQAVTVPTGSMQNTIMIGDHLLVNKFIFAPGPALPFLPMRNIERGDIIVFKYPGNPHNPAQNRESGFVPYQTNYVKRVIGLPGDTVEFRNAAVYINGKLLPEHRIIADTPPDSFRPDKVALDVISESPRQQNETYDVYYNPETIEAAEIGLLRDAPQQFHALRNKPEVVPANQYFVMGDSRDHSADSRFWGFVPRDLIVGRAMFVYWSCDLSQGDGTFECLTNPRLSRIGKLIK